MDNLKSCESSLISVVATNIPILNGQDQKDSCTNKKRLPEKCVERGIEIQLFQRMRKTTTFASHNGTYSSLNGEEGRTDFFAIV